MMVTGTVVHGKGEGKKIGYPTANVAYAGVSLYYGVFYCTVRRGEEQIKGLAVVGMWAQENDLPSLEVHLLDFSGDLYDQKLEVDVGEKLRDLKKFDSAEVLVAQIKKDVEDARSRK